MAHRDHIGGHFAQQLARPLHKESAMRLISYGPFGSERAGFLDGDEIIDLEQAIKVAGAAEPVSDMRLFLEQRDWRATLDRANAARPKVTPVPGPVRLGAPVP